MNEDRRSENRDRRKRPRGGRRPYDDRTKPWYMRRRLWLAIASLTYVSWRRMRGLASGASDTDSRGLAA